MNSADAKQQRHPRAMLVQFPAAADFTGLSALLSPEGASLS